MEPKLKLSALSLAIVSSLSAYAQDSEPSEVKSQTETPSEVVEEEVIVSGFRSSIQKARDTKRNAQNIVDSIHAEDIGKSTDQNIGDALSRITGISVTEEDGEGTKIVIRGTESFSNQISLNGVVLTSGLNRSGDNSSTGFDQSVDLSSFSSDILASIDVVKTPSADHDEGSLGANVILRTIKPLNLKKRKVSVNGQGRYNDFSEEGDYKFGFTVGDKFLDDTLGLIVTFADEEGTTRSDKIWSSWAQAVPRIPAGRARDTAGNIITEDIDALVRSNSVYSLNLNKRSRQTGTLGVQFAPTDTTDIQLDISHTSQTIDEDLHSMAINTTISSTQITSTDPLEDWLVVDTDRNVLVKNLGRGYKGKMSRRERENEIAVDAVTFKLAQEITDTFRVDLTAGYARTKEDTVRDISATTANWFLITRSLADFEPGTFIAGEDVEPVGYDCTRGGCSLVTGESLSFFIPSGDGEARIKNIARTQFNPADLQSHHLGSLQLNENTNTDTNKSVFIDFDWDVNWGFFSQVEFGYKWSDRVKDLVIDEQTLASDTVPVFDAEGREVFGRRPQDVLISEFLTGEPFPVDNFLAGTAGAGWAFERGWGLIDPERALTKAFGIEGATLVSDPSGSNRIEQGNESAYLKFNFEALGGRLSGDLGVRYVETEVSAGAFNSVEFNNSSNNIVPYDVVYRFGLTNPDDETCASKYPDDAAIRAAQDFGNCFEYQMVYLWDSLDIHADTTPEIIGGRVNTQPRPDGTGWDDSLYLLQVDHSSGSPVIVRNEGFNTHPNWAEYDGARAPWRVRRWVDRTTNNMDTWGGENGNSSVPGNGKPPGPAANQRSFASTDSYEYTNVLPSLNVNFLLTEEVIFRFATSKTISRPRFNLITPSTTVNESIWANKGWGTANNTRLEPLESTNIDVAAEWYFDDTGLLGITFFNKDITGYPTKFQEDRLLRDIRTEYNLQQISAAELLLPANVGLTPADGCMPRRHISSQTSEQWDFGCRIFNVGIARNAQGGHNRGVEFSYIDDFTFLPGVFSHLGLNFNYTYTDAKTDAYTLEDGTRIPAIPLFRTPKHSANAALYWEREGTSVRLAHRYSDVQFIGDSAGFGKWQDETNRLDLSVGYRLNKHINFSLQVTNLTDMENRQFVTGGSPAGSLPTDLSRNDLPEFAEGNPIDDSSVDRSKVFSSFKTGVNYRLGVTVDF